MILSATLILREINFEDIESSKTTILAVSEALKIVFGEIQRSKIAQNGNACKFWNPKT